MCIYSAFVGLDTKRSIYFIYLPFHFVRLCNSDVMVIRNTETVAYRGADKSLVRPGRKQANVSVRMA